MKILFTGGGTMGSVMPLIAIAEKLKNREPNNNFYWLGTRQGPEKKVIRNYNIEFKAIYSGKLRRYFSWLNFLDILKVIVGFIQALFFLIQWKPQIIVSAGGFTAVPVVWAGWLLGMPSLIHQQDVRPGLANQLCAKCASKITVCFAETAKYFKLKKTVLVGNPVREALKFYETKTAKQKLNDKYGFKKEKPIVLVMGGGTGALALNRLVLDSLDELTKFSQIVHISGGKLAQANVADLDREDYYHYNFLVDNTDFLSAADVIVSRAGMSSLTEIAYLAKPAIIMPLPDSHQEDNADYFYQRGAVIKLEQNGLSKDKFVKNIKELVVNRKLAEQIGQRAHSLIKWGAEEKIAEIIMDLIKR